MLGVRAHGPLTLMTMGLSGFHSLESTPWKGVSAAVKIEYQFGKLTLGCTERAFQVELDFSFRFRRLGTIVVIVVVVASNRGYHA